MPYMTTFDGCARHSPVPAETANIALEIGEKAAAEGCLNVRVQKIGDEDVLPLKQFAVRCCSRSPRFG
jgi:hypothetical protein